MNYSSLIGFLKFYCPLILSIWLSSCENKINSPVKNAHQSSLAHPLVRYAQGFRIKNNHTYTILYLLSRSETSVDTSIYLLLPHGSPQPDTLRSATIIRTPVKRMITTSSTHTALVAALDAYACVIGHSNPEHIYNPKIRALKEAGAITDVGQEMSLNLEQTIALKPDLVMAMAAPNQVNQTMETLKAQDIPILYNADWQENSVEARAEWIKVMGVLTGKMGLAESIFANTLNAYDSLKHIAATASLKPWVMVNAPYKETWHVAGGESYMAKLIEDAGAQYYWTQNAKTGGVVVSLEQALEAGMKCDFWINVSGFSERKSLLEINPILKNFKSVLDGKVYNYTLRQLDTGGNDYWETGMTRPDLVLADLIKIFHPDLLPSHKLYFYTRLP